MAKIYNKLEIVTTDGVLAESKSISGSYMSLTTDKRDSLSSKLKEEGMLIYNLTTKQFEQLINNVWVKKNELSDEGLSKISSIGDLNDLETQHKDNLVKAINDAYNHAGSGIEIDDTLSSTSINPVQNKIITKELNDRVKVVSGKQLSTNDFTNTYKNQLSAYFDFGGDISSDELSTVSNSRGKYFNIIEEFETDNTFLEGSGILYPADTKVIGLNEENYKWTAIINGKTLTSFITQFEVKIDNNSLVVVDDKIQLKQEWINYLTKQLYDDPTSILSTSSITTVEYGTEVNIKLSHQEKNIKNIKGNLKLLVNNIGSSAQYQPSEQLVSDFYSETRKITNSITYQLSYINTLDENMTSNMIKFQSYTPNWIVNSQNGTITSNNLNDSDKVGSSIKGIKTKSVNDNDYIFFISQSIINKITSGGFDVPIEKQSNLTILIENVSFTYNVYRTSNALINGTYEFDIQ